MVLIPEDKTFGSMEEIVASLSVITAKIENKAIHELSDYTQNIMLGSTNAVGIMNDFEANPNLSISEEEATKYAILTGEDLMEVAKGKGIKHLAYPLICDLFSHIQQLKKNQNSNVEQIHTLENKIECMNKEIQEIKSKDKNNKDDPKEEMEMDNPFYCKTKIDVQDFPEINEDLRKIYTFIQGNDYQEFNPNKLWNVLEHVLSPIVPSKEIKLILSNNNIIDYFSYFRFTRSLAGIWCKI